MWSDRSVMQFTQSCEPFWAHRIQFPARWSLSSTANRDAFLLEPRRGMLLCCLSQSKPFYPAISSLQTWYHMHIIQRKNCLQHSTLHPYPEVPTLCDLLREIPRVCWPLLAIFPKITNHLAEQVNQSEPCEIRPLECSMVPQQARLCLTIKWICWTRKALSFHLRRQQAGKCAKSISAHKSLSLFCKGVLSHIISQASTANCSNCSQITKSKLSQCVASNKNKNVSTSWAASPVRSMREQAAIRRKARPDWQEGFLIWCPSSTISTSQGLQI